MDKEPLISILTPAYNQGQYIEQTIQSVLSQTYENWEWIIIDDGSTDATRDIIGSYKDERIRCYRQRHGGIDSICSTHNKALGLSKGDFIALIDGDDLWPGYKLERQLKSFRSGTAVLSYGECCLIDSEGGKIDYITTPQDRGTSGNDPVGSSLPELLLTANSFIYNPTVLIRSSSLKRIGGFVSCRGLAHDFPTWCRLSLEGTFRPVRSCLGFWRRHPSSLIFSNAEYRFRNKIPFVKDFLELHEKKIESLGISLTKDDSYPRIDMRLKSFIEHFSYDRAMLLARMGMFEEAKEEFGKYKENNSSLKNTVIDYLFSLSQSVRRDFVNPARRLKEKMSARRP